MALGERLQYRVEFNVPTEPVVHSFSIIEYLPCSRIESCAGDTTLNKTVPALRKLSVRLLDNLQRHPLPPAPVLFLFAATRIL